MSHESDTQTQTDPDADSDANKLAPRFEGLADIDGGQVLFWSLIIISGYMFLTAQQFSPDVGLFPQLAAGIVLVSGGLKWAVNFLNQKFDFSYSSESESESDAQTETPGITDEEGESLPLAPALILGALITAYIVIGYFVGLLWVTPLFVASYMLYSRQSWLRTVTLTIVLTAVAYGFMLLMNLDLATGAV